MLGYVYGFVRVCSESDRYGKESDVQLFGNWEERNRIMYFDYSETFDNMSMEGIIGDTDANGNTKQDEQEFMQKKCVKARIWNMMCSGLYRQVIIMSSMSHLLNV